MGQQHWLPIISFLRWLNRWLLMEQSAEEGIDFQLFSVSHHCHKADKYLSRFSTCDSRLCSETPLEDETVSDLSVIGASLLWFFLHGHFRSTFTFTGKDWYNFPCPSLRLQN